MGGKPADRNNGALYFVGYASLFEFSVYQRGVSRERTGETGNHRLGEGNEMSGLSDDFDFDTR